MLTLLVIEYMDDFIVSVHFSSSQMIFSCRYGKENYSRKKYCFRNSIKSSTAVLDHKLLWCLGTAELTAGNVPRRTGASKSRKIKVLPLCIC